MLLARIEARDLDALAALFDRHGAAAFGMARWILGAGGDAPAADVVADIFLAVWRQRFRHHPADRWSVETWLLRHVRACAVARRASAGRLNRRHEHTR